MRFKIGSLENSVQLENEGFSSYSDVEADALRRWHCIPLAAVIIFRVCPIMHCNLGWVLHMVKISVALLQERRSREMLALVLRSASEGQI